MSILLTGKFRNFDTFKLRTIPREWFEGFENGSFSNEWTINDQNFKIKTDNVYEGNYSAGVTQSNTYNDLAYTIPYIINGGYRITFFEFYYYEDNETNGGGLRLLDSEDNFILGIGSDNPEWYVDDGNGLSQIYQGDDDQRWHYVKITFNWDNSTYDIKWKDLTSGTEKNISGNPLKKGTNIEKIVISNFDTLENSDGWKDPRAMRMWFDNLFVKKK